MVGTYVPRRVRNFFWELIKQDVFGSVSQGIRYILLKIVDGEIDFEGPDGTSLAEAVYGKKPRKRMDSTGNEAEEMSASGGPRNGDRALVRPNTRKGLGRQR